ncbi:MAG: M55 family metallopeptidase [Treponema sp.]|nr:M55 family metallopeptidase [Treponema sp.]
MQKFFISADIEGVAGVVDWNETDLKESLADYYKKQMSKEVAAACETLHKGGVKEVLVKDAHGSGRSITPSMLPKATKILRSWPRNPYSMMGGIDESFQGAGFIGYHSGAGYNGNPLAHTMNGNIFEFLINDIKVSEFVMNAWTATHFNVPVFFLSGDKQLCEVAKTFAPNIKTAAITEGIGGGSISIHPDLALEEISAMVKSALDMDPKKMLLNLPDKFDITLTVKRHEHAYRISFYPGVKQTGAHNIKVKFKTWMEVLTFIFFTFSI